MRRLLGIALILHGLAHASAGMWATDIGGRGLVTLLWEGASLGFILAGIGLLGSSALHRPWRVLVAIAVICSLALLLLFSHPLFVAGIAADFFFAAVAIWTLKPLTPHTDLRPLPKMMQWLLVAFAGYVALAIVLRPWHSSWGTTRSEQQMTLIGDPPIGDSHYRIDHAITIDAPVDTVWKWLVQIGQDRAGFYSYDWLERIFGAGIHNADTIVVAWQSRNVGDLVHATQSGYLGGIFGDQPGWRVKAIEPGRAMVLEGWGAFVLSPVDANSTRMHIRTRGKGIPTLSGIAITPIALLVFEPAHFIMERGMLKGLKARAERATRRNG
ncbi:MAG TPA: hypothetical protein VIF83_14440 [Gemmatimonadaceae bacterium]